MDSQIVTVVISGLVSLTGAFGSILLKDHLDRRRSVSASLPQSVENIGDSETPPRSLGGTVIRTVAMVILGYGAGTLADQEGSLLAVLPVFVIPILILLFYLRRSNRSAAGFQISILAYWAAVTTGTEVSRGRAATDTLVILGGFWIGSAIVGAIAFALTRPAARSR